MNNPLNTKTSELLLPVGDMDMCLAAIHNGADAVYIGMPGFNARGRAKDHSLEELREMVNLCHLFGVHVHLAFNILLFQDELPKAIDLLKEVLPMGIDAFIVQDLGLARIIRAMAPKQIIHGSTQMTVTNELAIDLLNDLDLSRFVLGREVSIPEMKKIREKTAKELEVFVHGALCVAYSGQCFTSEAIGGRSANRGQCAQSCRLDYDLIVDDKVVTSLDRNYVVSPKDLFGLEQIEELQEIGIDSFKVEGRLKGPGYVSSVGRLYKSKMLRDEKFSLGINKSDVERTYSRGFFSGWLHGVDHQSLVDGSYSNHRGELIGEVGPIEKTPRSILIKTQVELRPGMGILFNSGAARSAEIGGFIYEVKNTREGKLVSMGRDFPIQKIVEGAKVFINKDPSVVKKLEQTVVNRDLHKRLPINIVAILKQGEPLKARVQIEGIWLEVICSEHIPGIAENRTCAPEQVESVLTALTGTAFKSQSFEVSLEENLFVAQKSLKDLKRKMLEALTKHQVERSVELNSEFNLESLGEKIDALETEPKASLNLLVRSQKQLKEFLSASDSRIEEINYLILDYEFGKDYRESLDILRARKIKCAIATTRILKPGEYHHLNVIKRLDPDAVLVRNLGALKFFKEEAPELVLLGDFSLNVSNSLSYEYLRGKGLSQIALGLDLNQWQIESLLEKVNAKEVEVFIHHHMPEFHMEHCVFAAFLSTGSSFRDCGKPCEEHRVALKDMYGQEHYLAADQECRNTMFKKLPISVASLIERWTHMGARNFRYEALWDSGETLFKKVAIYLDVIAGRLEASRSTELLHALEGPEGVSLGQLNRRDTYVDRKQN